ncbi:MAG: UDP-glucuronic acid decarboxylase family protein [Bacteroidales bacterium]
MKKRILVTGGSGFIGSHLCEKLLEQDNEVICLDNYFTGSKQNILHLLDNPYFELVRHDITQSYFAEVDEIYNLACPASPIHYQYNPIKTIKTSVMGAINMLGLAKRVKAKILQASTSEVYGDPTIHPQTEDYWGNVNPIGQRSCYDEGKRCAESLFINYNHQNGVNIRIARIFNTYGPRMSLNDGRVISNFILQALKGESITIFGKGTQTRSFQYVNDLVDALIKLMNADDSENLPINIGNPDEFTIMELAEKIIQMTNSTSTLSFHPLPENDPVQRQPDISKAKEILGWEPKVNLEEGLTKTIEYFINEIKQN